MHTNIQLSDNKAPSRIQLLRVGDFKYSDQEKLEITKEMLDSFKKNFDDKVRGYNDGKLPIDYFHDSDKIAAGWISDLEIKNEGTELWAEVEWTKSATSKIEDRELRYVSVEFHTDYQDNESGKKFGPTLFGAGLTNRPFVKSMKAIAASEKTILNSNGGTMNLEEAKKKIEDLEKENKDLKEKLGCKDKENKSMSEKIDGIEKTLSEERAERKAEKVLNEKTAKFNELLAEGKVVAAQKDAFISGDMVKFSELAVKTNTKTPKNTQEPQGGEYEDPQLEVMKRAQKLQEKDSNLDLGDAIKQVLLSDEKLNGEYNNVFQLTAN